MGQLVELSTDRDDINLFMSHLVTDIKALERMLKEGLFEHDIRRIGAEQELCLVDKRWRPSPMAMEVLDLANDPHFTTEHSKYNLEINLDPYLFEAGSLARLEQDLLGFLARLDKIMHDLNGGSVITVGILPTIRRTDLELKNLTPLTRYRILNDAMNKLRGGPYDFHIEGKDELITKSDTIMFEGCNTSFQVHLQLDPATAMEEYNWSQAISGPLLATATNSPVFLGKRLWRETRIALFQQSVDTRRHWSSMRNKSCRITFGEKWLTQSITEQFIGDLARYRVMISRKIDEGSLNILDRGEIPTLPALQLHNGTVYRWNRICYGITAGKPHLRLENRILPAGPSVVDEIANAAFWLGMMRGMPEKYRQINTMMDFDDVKANFIKAAQYGLDTVFQWHDRTVPAKQLILEELLPIAHDGLQRMSVSGAEIDRYLGIIKDRVTSGKTGSQWILDGYKGLSDKYAVYEASVAITSGVVRRQRKNVPVHLWEPGDIREAGQWVNRYWKVEQIMTSDFFSVRSRDLIHFAANIMSWKHLRYIPVETLDGRLAGLLSQSNILNWFSTGGQKDGLVCDIMVREPLTVDADSLSIDALTLMRSNKIGCLPVIHEGRLVGMLTEHNFLNFSEATIHSMQRQKEQHMRKINQGMVPPE